jgi:hypothetical protein
MSQVSIPCVAYFPLEDRPAWINPSLLLNAAMITPDHYLDTEHHRSIYCPNCGVMCSRVPRKKAKRQDNVHAFYAHIRGFSETNCPHRKPDRRAGGDGLHQEIKAISLVTLESWHNFEDDGFEDQEDGKLSDLKQHVRGGAAGIGQGVSFKVAAAGAALNAGKVHTVRRLIMLAKTSPEIYVQLPEQGSTRLRDLIVRIENIQKNGRKCIGKSFIFVGRPGAIDLGYVRVLLKFFNPELNLFVYCDPEVFNRKGWKISDSAYHYVFYGLLEANESHSYVRISKSGQIHRLPLSHCLVNSLP